jgi:hypothetical protein
MAIYYVSSANGSDSNNGTSFGAAFATLQAAADVTRPGDVVEVESGTYNASSDGGTALIITTSGTANAPITYEAAPGAHPVINVQAGAWGGIQDNASWTVIKGFEVEGDAQSVTLSYAQSQETNLNNASTQANGICVGYVDDPATPAHDVVEDNVVHDLPGGGICAMSSDYVTIMGNTVYGTSHWSPFGNSGISLYASRDVDSNTGIKNYIIHNTTYDNYQSVSTQGQGGVITDGEGIIVDDNSNDQTNGKQYGGTTLVENNLSYKNGSNGLQVYDSSKVDVLYNTAYGNDPTGLMGGQIFVSRGGPGVVVENNIADAGPPSSKTIGIFNSTPVAEDYNVVYGGTTQTAGPHDIRADPMFTNAASADFMPQAGSPAINAANTAYTVGTDLLGAPRPAGGGYDVGALQYQGAATPTPSAPGGVITVSGTQSSLTIAVNDAAVNATTGNHMIFVTGTSDSFNLSGGTETILDTGAGGNTFHLPPADNGKAVFNALALSNTDVFDLTTPLANTTWSGSGRSLGSYLHVVQSGGNTELLVSAKSSRHGGTLIATFDNVQADLVTIRSHLIL